MNDPTTAECPRIEEISALIDGALTPRAAEAIESHAAHCPLCGAALRNFTAVGARLHALRETRSEVDIAALVGSRLPPRVPARPQRPRRRWGELWHLVPGGLGAAAALLAGSYLGMLLLTGGATALRPAAIAVFDAVPPGALCAGLPSCSPRGR